MDNSGSIYMGKTRLPLQFLFIGLLAMVAGINNLMDYSNGWIYIVIGIILTLGGLAVFTLQKSVYLDTNKNQLISLWSCLFWYQKESIKQLPEMSYLTVVSVKTSQLKHHYTISYLTSECKCNVNLAFNSSRMRYLNLITVKKRKAFEYAFHIAEKANIPVLDATERKKKWVKSEGDVIFKK
ncbi:MAG: hypothetical protein ACOCPM_01625 [Bacteroidales bacterium]